MGDFDGIEKATVSGERLPPMRTGKYVLEVENLLMIDTRKAGRCFVGEYKVLKAEPGSTHKEGERVSHLIKKNDMFLGNIKTLVAAVKGTPLSAVNGKDTEPLVTDAQPGRGKRIVAEAYQIMIGPLKDKPFTKVTYAPVAANGK